MQTQVQLHKHNYLKILPILDLLHVLKVVLQ